MTAPASDLTATARAIRRDFPPSVVTGRVAHTLLALADLLDSIAADDLDHSALDTTLHAAHAAATAYTGKPAWHLALCHDCEPTLPQPFRDKAERDRWASGHEQGTGHRVTRSEHADNG